MLEITANSNYMKPVILIKNNQSEILTTNSICLLKGEVGSGKSRLAMNIMVGLSGTAEGLNLEYTKCPDDKHVIYLSTEMSPYHLQRRLLKVLSITGKEYQDKLKVFDINGVNKLSEEIKEICSKYNPYVIIIDQLADFLTDVNSIEQSKQLLEYLNSIIKTYNTSIIAIIHQNEDSGLNSKARGHLGSLLEQKSVCSIAIAKTSKLFKIKTTKMREGCGLTMNAEYDVESEMLKQVVINNEEIVNEVKFPIDATGLINHYMNKYKKSESYVRSVIKKQVADGVLTTTKQGKQVMYNKL